MAVMLRRWFIVCICDQTFMTNDYSMPLLNHRTPRPLLNKDKHPDKSMLITNDTEIKI